MQSMNRITLIGNLGDDPETRTFKSGDISSSFSLATTERWKDDAGETQAKTQWHRVNILNRWRRSPTNT
jgi:single-strand DNA-binding protein